MRTILLFLLVCGPAVAQQAEFAPGFGRYMPLYPGMYFSGGYAQDDRDAVFDQNGTERDSAAPSSGKTEFPQKAFVGSFLWHFPMFESYGLPFLSSRTHFARLNFSHTDNSAEGDLATFAADSSDDASTEADKLENNGSGIGDVSFEFGSYLYGSPAPQWRERERAPFAVFVSLATSLPFGAYNRDAPINAGSNTAWLQGRIGTHWQPWSGGFVDAGFAYREYFENYDAHFGRMAPTNQGDDVFLDGSLAQRLPGGLYLVASAAHRKGDPNLYENPRFAPNPPSPTPTSSMAPAPGAYYDGGTALTTLGASLNYFVTQRWLAAVHYLHPRFGKSGEFDLPYNEHEPAGCKNDAPTCQTSPAGVVRVDGLGPARSYASDRVMVTLTYSFGLGDAFTCTGCEE